MAWVKPSVGDVITCRQREEAYYSGDRGYPVCFFEPGETGVVAHIDAPPTYGHRSRCIVDFYKKGLPMSSGPADNSSQRWWRVSLHYDNIRIVQSMDTLLCSPVPLLIAQLDEVKRQVMTIDHHLAQSEAHGLAHHIRILLEARRSGSFPFAPEIWQQKGEAFLTQADSLFARLESRKALEELTEQRGYRDMTRFVGQQMESEGKTYQNYCTLQTPNGQVVTCHTSEQMLHLLEEARSRNETEATRTALEPKNTVLWTLIRQAIQDLDRDGEKMAQERVRHLPE